MDKGRLAERGTHAELMERRGLYYEMVAVQGRLAPTGTG
jgi:ABC-type multidrug transport system fused ATPase/permease subunit